MLGSDADSSTLSGVSVANSAAMGERAGGASREPQADTMRSKDTALVIRMTIKWPPDHQLVNSAR
jgi:hypothetical protein